jgi:hypothetical protein
MDTEQLVAECRDYFKDTFGFRPETYLSGSNFETRAYYITLIMACDEYNENNPNNDGWDE